MNRPTMPGWGVDYLSATVHTVAATDQERWLRAVMPTLGGMFSREKSPARVWEAAPAHHGYQRAARHRDWGAAVHVEWAGTQPQGVHIVISGQPLTWHAARATDGDRCAVLGTLETVLRADTHDLTASRLDIALDNDLLTPAAVWLQRARGGLVCRLQEVRETSAADGGKGTLYLGSRQSGAMVRVYDKAAEQAGKDLGLRAALAPWYRLEVEYHDERANRVWDAYREHGRAGVAACVDQVVSFRIPGPGPSSRWDYQDWWGDMLRSDRRLALRPARTAREEDLDRRLSWAGRAVGAVLHELAAARGDAAVQAWLQQVLGYQAARAALRPAPTADGLPPASRE